MATISNDTPSSIDDFLQTLKASSYKNLGILLWIFQKIFKKGIASVHAKISDATQLNVIEIDQAKSFRDIHNKERLKRGFTLFIDVLIKKIREITLSHDHAINAINRNMQDLFEIKLFISWRLSSMSTSYKKMI